jgi:hypothetical protein
MIACLIIADPAIGDGQLRVQDINPTAIKDMLPMIAQLAMAFVLSKFKQKMPPPYLQ